MRLARSSGALALVLIVGGGARVGAVESPAPIAEPARPPDAGAAPARTPDASTTPARTIAEEVRALRTEVEALRRRPEPATSEDLERLRTEIARLGSAQRDLARRIDDRMVPPAAAPDPPATGTSGLAPLLLAAGTAIGFIASRMLQRQRDGRQRGRLRL